MAADIARALAGIFTFFAMLAFAIIILHRWKDRV